MPGRSETSCSPRGSVTRPPYPPCRPLTGHKTCLFGQLKIKSVAMCLDISKAKVWLCVWATNNQKCGYVSGQLKTKCVAIYWGSAKPKVWLCVLSSSKPKVWLWVWAAQNQKSGYVFWQLKTKSVATCVSSSKFKVCLFVWAAQTKSVAMRWGSSIPKMRLCV